MIEKVAGLKSGPSADGDGLLLRAAEIAAIEVEESEVDQKLGVFEGLPALFQLPLAKVKRLIEIRVALLSRS